MAKKVSAVFEATLKKNPEKGGAWLARVSTRDEGMDENNVVIAAWSNASAGKRWIKERVQSLTPRKSVKLEVTSEDENGKPIKISGTLIYKQEI